MEWAILSTMTRGSSYGSAASGCYDATRAAALSGVPQRTVYHWARTGVLVPSVSASREMFWSYADLVTLRIIAWLRRPKTDEQEIPLGKASPMREVRHALGELERAGIDLWSVDLNQGYESRLWADASGRIFLHLDGAFRDLKGERMIPSVDRWDLLGPFAAGGMNGPNLVQPREHLRIVPARVSGEPHVVGTRITSQTLAGLASEGWPSDAIGEMYGIDGEVVDEAVSLERDLAA